MRGIILEINKRSMIVLTHDNQYMKVKTGKQMYGIGDEIQFPAPDHSPVWNIRNIPFMKPVLAGAALCIVLVSIFPMLRSHPQTLPVEAYVSVDINPSLEVGVDSKLHVGSIHPFNEDGSKVISQLTNWKGESLQDVVDSIIQISDRDGFLRGDRHVLVSTNVVSQDSSFANSVDATVQQIASAEESKQHVTIRTMKGSTSIRNTSASLGVSEGKYLLYEDAKQRGIHVSLQHVKETSISDLDRELQSDNPKKNNKSGENKNSSNITGNAYESHENNRNASQIVNEQEEKLNTDRSTLKVTTGNGTSANTKEKVEHVTEGNGANRANGNEGVKQNKGVPSTGYTKTNSSGQYESLDGRDHGSSVNAHKSDNNENTHIDP